MEAPQHQSHGEAHTLVLPGLVPWQEGRSLRNHLFAFSLTFGPSDQEGGEAEAVAVAQEAGAAFCGTGCALCGAESFDWLSLEALP